MKCFVYPKKTIWSGNCLQIARESEDGRTWFGVKEAIVNYCEEMDINIKNVEWCVWCEPQNDYVTIKANTYEDWFKQFSKLDVVWEG